MHYLGIDLGGTNIAVGIVDEENKIIARANSKTQTENAEQVADAMAETARQALQSAGLTLADVPWIGVGSPGTINKSTGIIEFANNLPFKNTPMQEMLSQRLDGKQVLMENDANAAAFGEYMAGALKGSDNAIAITLGTGVGGGIIINHKIYSGSNFAGAELGHTVIVVDGRPCSCGRQGCWEAYASATGLIKTTKEHMADAPKDSPLWTIAEGNMDNVNGRTAFDAMRQGDPVGKEIVDEYIKYFSVGLIDMINIFQPDILCVGGGISNEGETLLAPVREYVDKEQYAMNSTKKTTICRAKLDDSLLSLFILAVFCNILIYLAVESYKNNPHPLGKYLGLFLGVAVFVAVGFEHCVANMFYFTVAGMWSGQAFVAILVMTLGNSVGGVLFPLCRRLRDKAGK